MFGKIAVDRNEIPIYVETLEVFHRPRGFS